MVYGQTQNLLNSALGYIEFSLTSNVVPMYFTGTSEVISEDVSYSYGIFQRVLCGNLSCIIQSFTA
jgi:hypothetical protein